MEDGHLTGHGDLFAFFTALDSGRRFPYFPQMLRGGWQSLEEYNSRLSSLSCPCGPTQGRQSGRSTPLPSSSPHVDRIPIHSFNQTFAMRMAVNSQLRVHSVGPTSWAAALVQTPSAGFGMSLRHAPNPITPTRPPRSNITSPKNPISPGHLQTPALLITPSNSSLPTPLATPAPPFASRIISLSTSSLTSSARSSAATRFRCASVIGLPPANSANASSTSASCAASDGGSRACSLSAQMPTKEEYVAKPSSSGSRIEMKSASSDLEAGGMPRALKGGGGG